MPASNYWKELRCGFSSTGNNSQTQSRSVIPIVTFEDTTVGCRYGPKDGFPMQLGCCKQQSGNSSKPAEVGSRHLMALCQASVGGGRSSVLAEGGACFLSGDAGRRRFGIGRADARSEA